MNSNPNPKWFPDTWREKPIKHTATYTNSKLLDESLSKLKSLPPLVSAEEVEKLRTQLAKVSRGEAFLLQGGDCAETFSGCNAQTIQDKIKIILQMSLVMIWGMRVPIVRIVRMGGQYAKPRSSPTETIDGETVLTFRGEIINGIEAKDREPSPSRLIDAYFHSAATLNYIRSLLGSNFADLNFPQKWDLDWVKHENVRTEYKDIIYRLADSFDFMRTIGVENTSEDVKSIDFYTSHEGLILDYEEAMTREHKVPKTSKIQDGRLIRNHLSFSSQTNLTDSVQNTHIQNIWYNTSAHFLWIGDRTRQIEGAHIEYFRGIRNPIGIKVGPSMDPDELIRVLDILDSEFEEGRVTLITRYGANKVEKHLPLHISAVQKTKHEVVWCCDPCHGK
ncbi:hypothetical protein BB559_002494 [Furculomyces boomerangus]|uniref:Phospho-2-dehydro-3-deoxyheptonate aldolase n=1 Tax=Furculomyces boomerangus TaxID=61424 RepID=A0A2T9YUZ8_9FUNG|nr:hypothetical protein BB559_002494 [Furculomyces boomerangus]